MRKWEEVQGKRVEMEQKLHPLSFPASKQMIRKFVVQRVSHLGMNPGINSVRQSYAPLSPRNLKTDPGSQQLSGSACEKPAKL